MNNEVNKKITEEIQALLKKEKDISLPELNTSISLLSLFHSVEEIEGSKDLRLNLKSPSSSRPLQVKLEMQIRKILSPINFPSRLRIRFAPQEGEEEKKSPQKPVSASPEEEGKLSNVKNIIAIGSGKGGVGKSTVAANLAIYLAKKSYKVGLIDADIYGPSLAKMFNLSDATKVTGTKENKIIPQKVYGVKLISFGFLINREQAIVWRGPMLGKAVEQFLFHVEWGELDYLIIDLPPGTGDVQLSLAQLVAIDGAIVVSTPQSVALQDAVRATKMFQQLKIPLLGVIENMSSYVCPKCNHTSHIFAKNGAASLASSFKMPLLGKLPLDTRIMEASERGKPIGVTEKKGIILETYSNIIETMEKEIKKHRLVL